MQVGNLSANPNQQTQEIVEMIPVEEPFRPNLPPPNQIVKNVNPSCVVALRYKMHRIAAEKGINHVSNQSVNYMMVATEAFLENVVKLLLNSAGKQPLDVPMPQITPNVLASLIDSDRSLFGDHTLFFLEQLANTNFNSTTTTTNA